MSDYFDHAPKRNSEIPAPKGAGFFTRGMVALALLGLVAAVCIALGFWQLDRAQLRRDLQHTIAQGRARSAVQLTPATPSAHLQDWRAAQAQGAWRHDLTVLLENRNQDGRPGYWVATPLMLDGSGHGDNGAYASAPDASGSAVVGSFGDGSPVDGTSSAGPDAAVLVLRGWLPRRFDAALPMVPAPLGVQRIHGQLLSRVPRIYELPSLWGKPTDARELTTGQSASLVHQDGGKRGNVLLETQAPKHGDEDAPAARSGFFTTPVVTNLTRMEAARITGLALLPAVLQQLPDPATPPDGLVRQWAGPSLDADKNVGYAIQWFSFAAIALCAALGVAWRTWRRLALRRKHHG